MVSSSPPLGGLPGIRSIIRSNPRGFGVESVAAHPWFLHVSGGACLYALASHSGACRAGTVAGLTTLYSSPSDCFGQLAQSLFFSACSGQKSRDLDINIKIKEPYVLFIDHN